MRVLKLGLALIFLIVVAGVALLYGYPEAVVRSTRENMREAAHLTRKEITLTNGLHYVYLEGGTGEPLLLLHGFGSNKDSFVRTAKYLTGKYQLIIPDHVGFAESAHPVDADYSPIAQARRLHEFAAALGLRQMHLGGSSMGGQIALTYAALYPADVKSLWLTDPAGVWSAPKSDMTRIAEETGRNPLMVQSTDDFIKMISFVMYKPPFIPTPMASVLARERIDNFKLE
jgi:pimeloyl-ACP methyl ester carboxylesterase